MVGTTPCSALGDAYSGTYYSNNGGSSGTWCCNSNPNPTYVPPPPTLNEKMPWLVYVVLGVACLVLLAILVSLANQAIRRHDQEQKPLAV